MAYITFDIGLFDTFQGQSVGGSGGKFVVCLSGQRNRATLFNPLADYAALANPVTFTGGRAKFALFLSAGQPNPPTVDIYGITPSGQWFVWTGAKPGNPLEIAYSTNHRDEMAVFPFSSTDAVPTVEFDTGFDLPGGALVYAPILAKVITAQASKTLSIGLLSSQTGGNATGFASGMSLAAVGRVKTTIGSGATLGALLQVASGGGATQVGEGAVISLATRITLTTSATTTAADGFITLPYSLSI